MSRESYQSSHLFSRTQSKRTSEVTPGFNGVAPSGRNGCQPANWPAFIGRFRSGHPGRPVAAAARSAQHGRPEEEEEPRILHGGHLDGVPERVGGPVFEDLRADRLVEKFQLIKTLSYSLFNFFVNEVTKRLSSSSSTSLLLQRHRWRQFKSVISEKRKLLCKCFVEKYKKGFASFLTRY